MSIDTLEKRASTPNFFLSTVLPLPDGDISAADRIQTGGEYSGIPAALISYPTTTIRERIILAIMSRLENIQITNGYNTDCGGTVLRAKKLVDPDSLPFINVWPQPEVKLKDYSKMICIMPVWIECLIEYKAENPSAKVSHMLSDLIENITGIDWILPFHAGVSEISVGDTIIGATSEATGYVVAVNLTSGTWVDNDAVGNLSLRRVCGNFQSEDLKIGDDVVASTIWPIYGTGAIENSTNNLADIIECTEGGTQDFPNAGNVAVGTIGIFNISYYTALGDPYNN